MSGYKIAFALTGSIAAYKACDVVSKLVQRGHSVRAVTTGSALRFVGAATLEALTGQPVLGDLFELGTALQHIELGRWADAIVVCPATANTINRFAAGLADDFLGTLFLARDPAKPFILAPAMNPAMWRHPATVASATRLTDWGVRWVPIGEGRAACGDSGEGRMAEPAEILAFVEATLSTPGSRQRVLVTSGPTAEPIDEVRVVTNTSTGRTGSDIALHLATRGHRVVLLRGRGAAAAAAPVEEEIFDSAADLDARLGRRLASEPFDAVIHAAAVADFSVDTVEVDGTPLPPNGGKLDSARPPVIRMRPTPKLVEHIRERSGNPRLKLVAFKLTAGAGADRVAEAVKSLASRSHADWVVHNDIRKRVDASDFPADIYRPDGTVAARCPTRGALAVELEQLISK